MIGWACWALVALFALAPPVWAQSAVAQLPEIDWSAPSSCPQSAYVAQRVRGLLRTAREVRSDLHVRAHVRRGARGRYLLELSMQASGYRGERRLESGKCRSLADAAAWLIAVALDPSLADGDGQSSIAVESVPGGSHGTGSVGDGDSGDPTSTPSASPPAPSRANEPDPPVQAATTQEEPASSVLAPRSPRTGAQRSAAAATGKEPLLAPGQPDRSATTGKLAELPTASGPSARRLPFWWRAGLFGGAWYAKLPALQATVGARAGLGYGHLYSELQGAWMPPRSLRVANVEARIATQMLGLAACAQWGDELRAGLCATAAMQRTEGALRDSSVATDRVLRWANSGLSVQLGWKRQWLELLGEVGAHAAISARPRFTVEGVGEVARASPVTVYARVGFGIRSQDMKRAK